MPRHQSSPSSSSSAAGWCIGVLEDHGYRPMRHDISDLAALTAHYATPWTGSHSPSPGSLTITFALALRHHLGVRHLLLALSLPGLDAYRRVLPARLPCRDAGRSISDATAFMARQKAPSPSSSSQRSGHGRRTLRPRSCDAPARGLDRPRRADEAVFGFVTIAVLVAGTSARDRRSAASLSGSRPTVVTGGVAILAWRVVRLEGRSWSGSRLMAGAVKLPTRPCWVANSVAAARLETPSFV